MRAHLMQVRLNQTELETIRQQAQSHGYPNISEYVRNVAQTGNSINNDSNKK